LVVERNNQLVDYLVKGVGKSSLARKENIMVEADSREGDKMIANANDLV